MTVIALPTRTTAQWAAAEDALREAASLADHPLASEHVDTAEQMLLDAGQPTTPWANRIAAIAVIAERRAEVAPSMDRRAAYLELAGTASTMLLLAHTLHDVHPNDQAMAMLGDTGNRSAALV